MGIKNLLVAIVIAGELSIHMAGHNANYMTACGLDGADEYFSVAQSTVDVPPNARINCKDCLAIWENAKLYKRSHFSDYGETPRI